MLSCRNPRFYIITQGKDLSDAIYMAKDAIHLTVLDMLEDNKTIPSASDISDFKSHNNSLITFVDLEI